MKALHVSTTPSKESIINYLCILKSKLKNEGIDRIGLFGSFATDHADLYSDIDIAIKLQQNYLRHHDVWDYFTLIENIKKSIMNQFGRQSDVFDLESSSAINDAVSKELIYV